MVDNTDVSVSFGAETDALEKGVSLVGESLHLLEAPIKAVGQAFESIKDKVEGVFSDVVSVVETAGKKLADVAGGILRSSFSLAEVLKIFGGGGAALAAVLEMMSKSDEAMAKLAANADRASISVGRLQQLTYAAGLRGVGADALAEALKKSADLVDEMGRKENDFSKLLDANKVRWKDQHGVILDTNSALDITADLVRRAANYSQAVKIADWAGYSEAMVPFLRQGAAAIADMARQAPVVSEELVRQRAEIQDNWNAMIANMSYRFKAFVVELTGWLQPLIDLLGKMASYTWTNLKEGVTGAMAALTPSNFADRFDALGDMLKTTTAGADTFTGAFRRAAEAALALGRGAVTKLPPEDKKADKDEIRAAMEAAAEEIRIQQLKYAQIAERINTNAKLFVITEQEKTHQLIAAVNERERAETAVLDKELKNNQLSKAQKQAVENEKTTIVQRATLDRQKIQDEALLEETKEWQSALGTLQSAWDSQLKGLLAGTTKWSTAMRSIFADLVLDIIKEFEKAAIAKAALSLAGMGTSPGAGGIGGSVFSAIASLATTLGSVIGLDTGGYVTQTGIAVVHQGETVVPAQASTPYGGASGGTTFHFNGPVIGTQAWINSMIPQLSRALAAYGRLNPSVS